MGAIRTVAEDCLFFGHMHRTKFGSVSVLPYGILAE